MISAQRRLPGTWHLITASLGAVIIGVTLWLWGQPLICTCGEVKLWIGSVFSEGNSQHIADWYTLSHVIHGMLVVLVGRLIMRRPPFTLLFAVAVITGIAWEIVEHTDWVLDRFRATTIYQGYIGDSVLNAVADYIWMLLGFFLANALKTVWVVAVILALEVVATVTARDSLTLTTLMVFHPVEAVETWQQEINPNPRQ